MADDNTTNDARTRQELPEPSTLGEGFGRLLMTEAEAWAEKQGCAEVRLRSSVTREDAHRFYEGIGYEIRKTSHVFCKSLERHSPNTI
jgi:ribosomal protein S18 acetylase RimI-like enzyme